MHTEVVLPARLPTTVRHYRGGCVARRGDIILDFDADGRLLGVEVIGATGLLRTTVLAAADRI